MSNLKKQDRNQQTPYGFNQSDLNTDNALGQGGKKGALKRVLSLFCDNRGNMETPCTGTNELTLQSGQTIYFDINLGTSK